MLVPKGKPNPGQRGHDPVRSPLPFADLAVVNCSTYHCFGSAFLFSCPGKIAPPKVIHKRGGKCLAVVAFQLHFDREDEREQNERARELTKLGRQIELSVEMVNRTAQNLNSEHTMM